MKKKVIIIHIFFDSRNLSGNLLELRLIIVDNNKHTVMDR